MSAALSLALLPDDLEGLPEGAFIDGSTARGHITDIADYVVIGSGAAGAVAAQTLAAAGREVIVLEEGPWVRTRAFSSDFAASTSALLRGAGAQFTLGRSSMNLVQGRAVGGTTTVNSAISARAPQEVIDGWGLGRSLDFAALEPHYDALEKALDVTATPRATMGENNRLFGEAARRLGYSAAPTPRFAARCEGHASCLTGCRAGKKLSMGVSFIPQALHAGARLYAHARATKVEIQRGRAVAVSATLGSTTLTAIARRGVIVCASAVQTPNLLARSGLSSRQLGKNFQCHPGLSLAARFDKAIHMERGATQGFHSLHFAKSHRFKLESVALQPELMAMNLPSAGRALVGRLERFEQLASWAVVLRAEACGRVLGLLGGEQVLFTPSRLDVQRARTGLKVLTEMLFAAGAREVFPNVHGMPDVLRSADGLALWDDAPLDPRAYSMVATHLFGTARAGHHHQASVVDTRLQCHEAERLFVLDSSVFPTNLGTNPQLTIMAIARLAAQRIAQ